MSEALDFLEDNAHPKVLELFKKKAGEDLPGLAVKAYNLIQAYGKTPERAMADVLESYRKKPKKHSEEDDE